MFKNDDKNYWNKFLNQMKVSYPILTSSKYLLLSDRCKGKIINIYCFSKHSNYDFHIYCNAIKHIESDDEVHQLFFGAARSLSVKQF